VVCEQIDEANNLNERSVIMKRLSRSAVSARLWILPTVLFVSAAFSAPAMSDKKHGYISHNLVSNDNGTIPADHQDTTLQNAWGITFFLGGPIWVNDNASGISTLYQGDGTGFGGADPALAVTIPPPMGGMPPSAPTGIVANTSFGFALKANSTPALFVFDTEDGTISAWNLPLGVPGNAELEVDNSTEKCGNGATGAVYKGLALGANANGAFLYATNFRCATLDVFDSGFNPAKLSGSFQDPKIPAGYAPFGIANVLGNLVVTYAKQDDAKHDDVAGPGHGFVDVFDTDGNLIRRFARRGHLNSPCGIAMAPFDFGELSGNLLIGNFGNGKINAFDPISGHSTDEIEDVHGTPIVIDGLWALTFGGGAKSNPGTLYFTAGPNKEKDGLFGSISPE
jgi:uncharacterized protein (TIGR03118 family)